MPSAASTSIASSILVESDAIFGSMREVDALCIAILAAFGGGGDDQATAAAACGCGASVQRFLLHLRRLHASVRRLLEPPQLARLANVACVARLGRAFVALAYVLPRVDRDASVRNSLASPHINVIQGSKARKSGDGDDSSGGVGSGDSSRRQKEAFRKCMAVLNSSNRPLEVKGRALLQAPLLLLPRLLALPDSILPVRARAILCAVDREIGRVDLAAERMRALFDVDAAFLHPTRCLLLSCEALRITPTMVHRLNIYVFSDILAGSARGDHGSEGAFVLDLHHADARLVPHSSLSLEVFNAKDEDAVVLRFESECEMRRCQEHVRSATGKLICIDSSLWVPDFEFSRCILCMDAFAWHRRRHHCRRCGALICRRCSRRPIRRSANHSIHREKRICSSCFAVRSSFGENRLTDADRESLSSLLQSVDTNVLRKEVVECLARQCKEQECHLSSLLQHPPFSSASISADLPEMTVLRARLAAILDLAHEFSEDLSVSLAVWREERPQAPAHMVSAHSSLFRSIADYAEELQGLPQRCFAVVAASKLREPLTIAAPMAELLQKLQKMTPTSHKDYTSCAYAYNMAASAVSAASAVEFFLERETRLASLLSRFAGDETSKLDALHRRLELVHDGEVDRGARLSPCVLVLFSNVLLLCKPRCDGLTVSFFLDLLRADTIAFCARPKLEVESGCEFEIVFGRMVRHSTRLQHRLRKSTHAQYRCIGLRVSSSESCCRWIQEISCVAQKCHAERMRLFSIADAGFARDSRGWVRDKAVSACSLCGSGFSMFLRRHHCRNCGTVVCSECSPARLAVCRLKNGQRKVRVCNRCRPSLQNSSEAGDRGKGSDADTASDFSCSTTASAIDQLDLLDVRELTDSDALPGSDEERSHSELNRDSVCSVTSSEQEDRNPRAKSVAVSSLKSLLRRSKESAEDSAVQNSSDSRSLDLNKGINTAPDSWMPNKSSKSCLICDRLFTVIRRRHHCRSCGSLVCKSCSSNRVAFMDDQGSIDQFSKQTEGVANSFRNITVRVCDRCSPEFQGQYVIDKGCDIRGK